MRARFFFAALLLLAAAQLSAQVYSTNFDNVAAGVLAENIAVPGISFTSSPAGAWQTFEASQYGFVTLSGRALFEPTTVSTLDVAFSSPAASVSFTFAMSTTPGLSSVVVQALSGSTVVNSVTQVTSSAGPNAYFGEGAIRLSSPTPFDKIRISASPNNELIAIDNLQVFGASIVITRLPSGMVQNSGQGGATDSFAVTNRGGIASTVTVQTNGNFYTASPSSFSLAPGASQIVTLTGVAQPAGFYQAEATLSGSGVSNLTIPVRLLSAAAPTVATSVKSTQNRVDVVADAGTNPTGSADFRNTGTVPISGLLVSDVPWLIPQSGVITIDPGQTRSVTFTIDRSKRSDTTTPYGSVTGSLSLVFPTTGGGKFEPAAGPGVDLSTRVSIVDTSKPPTSSATLQPLAANEVALFVPGVGHIAGSVGTFVSDVNIGNAADLQSISGINLYYVPIGGGTAATATNIPTLLPSQGLGLADIVKNVFGADAQVGSLQIRGPSLAKLAVSASIFNASNSAGTFGTSIPTFRSDRGVTANGRLYLTGLLKDSTHHTNLFLQEVSGNPVTARTEFLDRNGRIIGQREDTVGAFNLLQINNPFADGTTSAVVTNISGSGKFSAYATPVDHASGDTWAVVDWNRQGDFAGTSAVVIPVAGSVHGANQTFFRTDLSLMNTGGGTASGTLRFIPSSGAAIERTVRLAALESTTLADVIGGLFGVTNDVVGFLTFTPAGGSSFALTSRTYTTVAGGVATFGTGVPTLALAASLRKGQSKIVSGLLDSSNATIAARVPATFRSNLGLLETGGGTISLRITLLGSDGRSLAFGALASRTVNLTPNQYLSLNQIGASILGEARSSFGDLSGVELRFEVLDGTGAVALYTSSIDNGTGDSILRTE